MAESTIQESYKLISDNESMKKELETLYARIGTRDSLEETIAHMQKEQAALANSSVSTAQKVSSELATTKAEQNKILDLVKAEREALDVERENIAEEAKKLAKEESKAKLATEELEKVRADIEKAKQEMEAREKEIQESKASQNSIKSELKSLKQTLETERLNLEEMRNTATAEVEKNRAILASIESARAGSEVLMADINKTRQEAEDRRVAAQNEVSSASYALDMARNMQAVFRQALNTYIQIAGQGIQIPTLTDEHRKFIAKDLLSQCADYVPEGNVDEEMDELGKLRKMYREKFEKKEFPGWTVEQLKTKLGL